MQPPHELLLNPLAIACTAMAISQRFLANGILFTWLSLQEKKSLQTAVHAHRAFDCRAGSVCRFCFLFLARMASLVFARLKLDNI